MPESGLWYALGVLLSLCLGFGVTKGRLGAARGVGPSIGVAAVALLLGPWALRIDLLQYDVTATSLVVVSLGLLLMPTVDHRRSLRRACGPFLVVCVSLAIGTLLGLPTALVDEQTLPWCVLFWFTASVVVQPLLTRTPSPPHTGRGFMSYRRLLPMEDREASETLRTELALSRGSSYQWEVISLTIAVALVQVGLFAATRLSGTDALGLWLLPVWALLCTSLRVRFALASPGLSFIAAAVTTWLVFSTLALGSGGLIGGFEAFILQAGVASLVSYAFRLPWEFMAPIAVAISGQPALAIAMPLLRGQAFLSKSVVLAMPVALILHWALIHSF